MYTKFHVRNFRALADVALPDLGRVNLVVGPNNVGKTSLLEALWLLHGAGNPMLTLNLVAIRGFRFVPLTAELLWHGLFHGLRPDVPISIEAVEADGTRHLLEMRLTKGMAVTFPQESNPKDLDRFRQFADTGAARTETLEFHYQRSTSEGAGETIVSSVTLGPGEPEVRISAVPNLPSGVFVSTRLGGSLAELASRFTAVQDAGQLPMLIRSLHVLEPRLDEMSLGYTLPEQQPHLRAHVGLARPIPLALLGGGTLRLTVMLLAVLTAGNGTILIDEIESGLYYRNLEQLWQALDVASAESGGQIMATTQSIECIQAAIRAFDGEHAEAFRLHRLERRNGEIGVVTYPHSSALAAFELDLEVR